MTLDPNELRATAEQFGVAPDQVRRDHAISVLLAALSVGPAVDELVFIGGTALSRTHLPDVRLSEDIDLLATAPRSDVAASIEAAWSTREVRRELGALSWQPPLSRTRGSDAAVVTVPTGPRIRVQLLAGDGYPRWPVELTDLRQRYSDVGPARLRVPNAEAFAAAKLTAWLDRRASRDLYDLWAMAMRGLITRSAADLFCRLGSFRAIPPVEALNVAPSDDWHTALGQQTRVQVEATEAGHAVAAAWRAVSS